MLHHFFFCIFFLSPSFLLPPPSPELLLLLLLLLLSFLLLLVVFSDCCVDWHLARSSFNSIRILGNPAMAQMPRWGLNRKRIYQNLVVEHSNPKFEFHYNLCWKHQSQIGSFHSQGRWRCSFFSYFNDKSDELWTAAATTVATTTTSLLIEFWLEVVFQTWEKRLIHWNGSAEGFKLDFFAFFVWFDLIRSECWANFPKAESMGSDPHWIWFLK